MNENQKYIFIGLFVAFVFLIGFWLGKIVFSRENVSDNGVGITKVDIELQSAQDKQSEITTGIQESKKLTDSISERIDSSQQANSKAQESAARIGKELFDSGGIIEENQSILRRVQERGFIETK